MNLPNQRICIVLNKLFWKTPMPSRFSNHDEWAEYWIGELADGPDDYRIEEVRWSREQQEFIPIDCDTDKNIVRLSWSPPAPPNEECRYDHCRAATPFGSFLLTWKSWKTEPWQDSGYGFDETPWGDVEYRGWSSVDEAQTWAEDEMNRRLKEYLSNSRE